MGFFQLAALGAAVAYFFDPDAGPHRRAQAMKAIDDLLEGLESDRKPGEEAAQKPYDPTTHTSL